MKIEEARLLPRLSKTTIKESEETKKKTIRKQKKIKNNITF